MAWEITGNNDTNPDSGHFLGTIDQRPLAIRTSNKEALRVDPTGNVGIGTSNPASKLEIHAQDGLQIVGFEPFLTLNDSNSGKRLRIQSAHGDVNFFTEGGLSAGIPAVTIKDATATVEIHAQDGLQIIGFEPFLTLNDSNSGKRLRIQSAHGDVNFFTEGGLSAGIPAVTIKDATATVEIHAQDGLQIIGFEPFLTLNDSNSGKRLRIQTAHGDVNFFTESGLSAGNAAVVIKDGTGDVVLSGDLSLSGADCAEHFKITDVEQIEAGAVVVIDQEGALRQSHKAYDRKVAGVVSGAADYRPGIVLDKQQSSDNRLPIALMGKVYCKVDAQYSPIELGDMLTTSPTPGHAMKAADPLKSFGAVIGKALRPLHEGSGLIPILVARQ